jgi:sugar phosphate isomerase/epimerase
MQFGVCCGPELAAIVRDAGYRYVEGSVGGLLRPKESPEAFAAAVAAYQRAELPCPAVNCFVPADLKITGPDVDPVALERYVAVVMTRAREAGVDTIVFGSGGARRIPANFERQAAWHQLVAFCRMAGGLAADNGVTVVVESLNRSECNVLNTVGECARLVRAVGHPAVRLLVDAYHMLLDGDDVRDIAANGELLAHVHIATVPGRLPPGLEPCDLAPFFAALAAAGYNGRVSIEGRIAQPADDLPRALQAMRAWNAAARGKGAVKQPAPGAPRD